MDEKTRFILCIVVVAIVAFYAGAVFSFFPFWFDNVAVQAVGFGTLIDCTVTAVCTCVIEDAVKGKKDKDDPDKKKENNETDEEDK